MKAKLLELFSRVENEKVLDDELRDLDISWVAIEHVG
jgi:hypothetical protein